MKHEAKFFAIFIGLVQGQDSPKVCNDQGTCFKGSVIEPGLATFQGIRYAQAPIGNLRFKPPIPINQDNLGTIDASETSTVKCPQHANTSNLLKSSNSTGLYSICDEYVIKQSPLALFFQINRLISKLKVCKACNSPMLLQN